MRNALSAASCLAASCLAAALAGPPAQAQDMYLDDRSDAAALVRSLYNAINRKEFGRAWDYFGARKPARDFKTFASGYAATREVTVLTGDVSSEGAAGTTFFHVPVAIQAFGEDGSERVFAGCYVAKLANPSVQETPFTPLQLEKGMLADAEGSLEDAVPARCEGAPPPDETDPVLRQVKVKFKTAFAGQCTATPGPQPDPAQPEQYRIPFRYTSDAESDPERLARLFRFYCSAGAYNETHVFYLHDEIEGLRELQFATPELDIRYENDDFEGKVESVGIIGYYAESGLVNSDYDETTKTLTSYSKWRGVGDASSLGTWIFRNGEFTLIKYEVDASYDGEINPETVLDYDQAP